MPMNPLPDDMHDTDLRVGDRVTERAEVEGAHTHGVVDCIHTWPGARPAGVYVGVKLDNGFLVHMYASSMRKEN